MTDDQPPAAETSEQSWQRLVDWINNNRGVHQNIFPNGYHFGSILEITDFHALQHIGRRKYVIHVLGDLDHAPTLNDPEVGIRYKNGIGTVTGGRSDVTADHGHVLDIFDKVRKNKLSR